MSSTSKAKFPLKTSRTSRKGSTQKDTLSSNSVPVIESRIDKQFPSTRRTSSAKTFHSSGERVSLTSELKPEDELDDDLNAQDQLLPRMSRFRSRPFASGEFVVPGPTATSDEYEEEEDEEEDSLNELHRSGEIGKFAAKVKASMVELPYGFDPSDTQASYFIGNGGTIINRGVISETGLQELSALSSPFSSEGEDEIGGEDYWEMTEEEEEEAFFERYSDYFTETEQALTDGELEEIREGLHYLARSNAESRPGFHFEDLDMSDRQLKDLSMVEQYTSLKSLNVSKNLISNIRSLGAMPNLVKLDASRNEITEFLDINPDQSFPLKDVDFSRNRIFKILDLKPFWALSTVNLSYNRLTLIDGFDSCTYLRVLNLSHNEISEIKNLTCPNLVVLDLKFNYLTNIKDLEVCGSLRYLNISNNQISELKGLKAFPQLMELRCQENNVEDLLELEHLKSLMKLSHLRVQPNPCMDVGMSRSLLIHMLPQVRYLDGEIVTPDEILEARNTFSPSFTKLAFEDHTNAMLEKACQSANLIFDEFCRVHPIPPIILLVGSSKSKANQLALHLKEKFKHDVFLGGVHSTATTIEGNVCAEDIPLSYETFMEMKNKGEFLATSHILGRLCGFATSQIARAAEKGAILVASVPLVTAISIRKWRFTPKYVLILPSEPPEFNVDQFIRQSIAKERLIEEDLNENEEEEEEAEIKPHSHLVSFAAAELPVEHHTAESATHFHTKGKILKHSSVDSEAPRPSIDETPLLNMPSIDAFMTRSFPEVGSGTSSFASTVGGRESMEVQIELEARELEAFGSRTSQVSRSYSKVSRFAEEPVEEIPPLVIKSSEGFDIAPEPDVQPQLLEDAEEIRNEPETAGGAGASNFPIYSRQPLHLMNEASPFTVTNRLRRLRRLGSILLTQAGATPSPLVPNNIVDIMMSLPGQIPQQNQELMDSIDWKKSILQNKLYNSLLETDEAYYMVLSHSVISNEIPEPKDTLRDTLMPGRNFFAEGRAVAQGHPVYGQEDQKKLDKYELVLVKEGGEKESGSKVKFQSGGQVSATGVDSLLPGKKSKTKNAGSVVFSEHNLKDIQRQRSRSQAEVAADKIRSRKKTAFNFEAKAAVSFAEEPRKDGLHQRSFSEAEINSEKIRSRKKTAFNTQPAPPSVIFSESNLEALKSQKEAEIDADVASSMAKISKRKKTGFVKPLTTSPDDSDEKIDMTLPEVEPGQLGEETDEKASDSSLKKRRPTVFTKKVLTPSDDDDDDEKLNEVEADPEPVLESKTSSQIRKRRPTVFMHKILTPDDSDESIKSPRADNQEDNVYINDSDLEADVEKPEPTPSAELVQNSSSLDVEDEESHATKRDSKTHRFKQRDAIELSILRTREEYHQYHLENPGFFSAVVDTADLGKCEEELEVIAKELLMDFKKELRNAGQFMSTYAGLNRIDEEAFWKNRVDFLNWCNHEWDKGYQHPLLHIKDKYGASDSCNHRSFFERKRPADNVLDPTLPRHQSSAKIRQLIRVGQHQRTRVEGKLRPQEKDLTDTEEFGMEEDLEAFLSGHNDEDVGRDGGKGGNYGEYPGEFYGEEE